jgi:hypothetical protein
MPSFFHICLTSSVVQHDVVCIYIIQKKMGSISVICEKTHNIGLDSSFLKEEITFLLNLDLKSDFLTL